MEFLVIIFAAIAVIFIKSGFDSLGTGQTDKRPNNPHPQQPRQKPVGTAANVTQAMRQQMWNVQQQMSEQIRQSQQQRPQQPAGVRSGQPQLRQAGQWNGQPRPQQSSGVRSNQPQPDIVQRAKANNARFDEDTTRESIEAMHGHSEAERKVEFEHSRNCQTLGSDDNNRVEAETQSMFGSVEDLIAMGYSGNLEFERDFLGEGLDMISNFY